MYRELLNLISSREWALCFIALLFLIWSLTKPGIREGYRGLMRAALNRHILRFVFSFVLYAIPLVYIFHVVEIWDTKMSKEFFLWFLFVALPFGADFIKHSVKNKDKPTIRSRLKGVLVFSAFVAYVINRYTFHFVVEVILLAVLIFFTLMDEYAKYYDDSGMIQKLTSPLLLLIYSLTLFFSIKLFIENSSKFDIYESILEVLMPFIWTILYIPLVCFWRFYSAYEFLILRATHNCSLSKLEYSRRKKEILKISRLSYSRLNDFDNHYFHYRYLLSPDGDFDRVVEAYRNREDISYLLNDEGQIMEEA
ncbi:hypothetical protein LJC40_07615 [Synergistaceae bacterium OttesenSCG-928-D05]|nr:hypothetical protein [Synergistaceae bacterium OttesenSCG-928-D05]